jgi:nucleoid-associated protein YgaU
MAIEKLVILAESTPNQFTRRITALFNPSQITIQKHVNWREAPAQQRDVPVSQHTHADPATLTMDLFFDTYEAGTDVRQYTNQVLSLATVEHHGNLHRPPVCRLMWGRGADFFQGVLQRLSQKFTMFLEDGTPVRATLSCMFKEWRDNEEEAKRQNRQSSDVAKTYIVRRGDTISSIAFAHYHDPRRWRPIARANQLSDPTAIAPGTRLLIPTLQAETERGVSDGRG